MKTLPLALLLLAAPALAKDKTPPPPVAPPLPASIDGLPIGAIPQQALPAKGCAAFLWTRGPSHALIAMAVADPATIRMSIDGTTRDLALSTQNGAGGYGFSQTIEYKGADVTATLDMTIGGGTDLASGARITDATIRIDRPGKDSLVVPAGGLIGCT